MDNLSSLSTEELVPYILRTFLPFHPADSPYDDNGNDEERKFLHPSDTNRSIRKEFYILPPSPLTAVANECTGEDTRRTLDGSPTKSVRASVVHDILRGNPSAWEGKGTNGNLTIQGLPANIAAFFDMDSSSLLTEPSSVSSSSSASASSPLPLLSTQLPFTVESADETMDRYYRYYCTLIQRYSQGNQYVQRIHRLHSYLLTKYSTVIVHRLYRYVLPSAIDHIVKVVSHPSSESIYKLRLIKDQPDYVPLTHQLLGDHVLVNFAVQERMHDRPDTKDILSPFFAPSGTLSSEASLPLVPSLDEDNDPHSIVGVPASTKALITPSTLLGIHNVPYTGSGKESFVRSPAVPRANENSSDSGPFTSIHELLHDSSHLLSSFFGLPASELLVQEDQSIPPVLNSNLHTDTVPMVTESTETGNSSLFPHQSSESLPVFTRLPTLKTPEQRSKECEQLFVSSIPTKSLSSSFSSVSSSTVPSALPKIALASDTLSRLHCEEWISKCLLLGLHGIGSDLFVIQSTESSFSPASLGTTHGRQLFFSETFLQPLVKEYKIPLVLVPFYEQACSTIADVGNQYLYLEDISTYYLQSEEISSVAREIDANIGTAVQEILTTIAGTLLNILYALNRRNLYYRYYPQEKLTSILRPLVTVSRTMNRIQPYVTLIRTLYTLFRSGRNAASVTLPHGPLLLQHLYDYTDRTISSSQLSLDNENKVSNDNLTHVSSILLYLFDSGIQPLLTAIERQIGRRIIRTNGSNLDGIIHPTVNDNAVTDPAVLTYLPSFLSSATTLSSIRDTSIVLNESISNALIRCADTYTLIRQSNTSLARSFTTMRTKDGISFLPNMYIPSLYVPYNDYQIYTNNHLSVEYTVRVLENIQKWTKENTEALRYAAEGTTKPTERSYSVKEHDQKDGDENNVLVGDSASVVVKDPTGSTVNEHPSSLPSELRMMVRIVETILQNYSERLTKTSAPTDEELTTDAEKEEGNTVDPSVPTLLRTTENDAPDDGSVHGPFDHGTVISSSIRDVFSQIQEGIRTDQYETAQQKRARAIAEAREVRNEQARREMEEQIQANERKRQEFERLTKDMEEAKVRKERERQQAKEENKEYVEELKRAEEFGISPLKGNVRKGTALPPPGTTTEAGGEEGNGDDTTKKTLKPSRTSADEDLYVTARLVLLRDFGERLRALQQQRTNENRNDAVMIALEALVSLGPSGAKQAQQLAKILGIPSLDEEDTTGTVNEGEDALNASIDTASSLPENSITTDTNERKSRPSTLNLFRVLPELETFLPEPIVTQIRILQPAGGGFDSAKDLIQGTMYDDMVPSSSIGIHSRVSQPPGGIASFGFNEDETRATMNDNTKKDHPKPIAPNHYSPAKSIIYGTDNENTNFNDSVTKDDTSSVVTHIRVNQPAGGTSTIGDYLYQDSSTTTDTTPLVPSIKNLSSEVQHILQPVPEPVNVPSNIPTVPTLAQEDPYHPSTKVLQPTGGYSSIGSIIHIGEAVDTLPSVITNEDGATVLSASVVGKEETSRPQIKVSQSPGGVSSVDSILREEPKKAGLSSVKDEEGNNSSNSTHTHIRILQPAGGGSTERIRHALYGGAWGNEDRVPEQLDEDTESVRPSIQITQEPGGNSTVQELLYLQKPGSKYTTKRTEASEKGKERSTETILTVSTIPKLTTESFDPHTIVQGFNEQIGTLFFSTNDIPNRLVMENEISQRNGNNNTTTDPILPIDMDEPIFTKRQGATTNDKEGKDHALTDNTSSSASNLVTSHGLFHQRTKPYYSGPFSIAIHSGILHPLRSHITLMDISGVLLLVYHYDLLTHLKALRDGMFGCHGYLFTTLLDYVTDPSMNDRLRGLIQQHNDLLHRLASIDDNVTNESMKRKELVSLITMNRKKIGQSFNNAYQQACNDTGLLHEFDTYVQEAKRRLRSHLYHGAKETEIRNGDKAKDQQSTDPEFSTVLSSTIQVPLSSDTLTRNDTVYSETVASILLESRAHCGTSALGANMHRFTYEPLPVYEYVSPIQSETLGYWNSQMYDNLVIPQYNLSSDPLTYMDKERQEWLKRTLGRKAIERIRTTTKTKVTEHEDTSTTGPAWSPLELVLTPEAMIRYASLHMFIVRVRRTEKELYRTWITLMSLKRYTTPRLRGWAVNSAEDALTGLTIPFSIYTLRHEASYFLHCLNGYITTTVLENGYQEMLTNMEYILVGDTVTHDNRNRNHNCTDDGKTTMHQPKFRSVTTSLTMDDTLFGKIDGIRSIHDQYLDNLLYRCFVPDPLLLKETTTPNGKSTRDHNDKGINDQRYKASQLIHNVLNTILEFCSIIEEQTLRIDNNVRTSSRHQERADGTMETIVPELFPSTVIHRIEQLQIRFQQSLYLLIKGLQNLSVQGGGFSTYIDDLLLRLGPWVKMTSNQRKR